MGRVFDTYWKTPPIAKVYEALSAIADDRIIMHENSATVFSSTHEKSYTVLWSPERDAFTSNDNGSYWQGYLGYPILCVLMIKKIVPYDATIAEQLSGIEWKKINDKFRGDYDKGISEALTNLESRGINIDNIKKEVERIYSKLQSLRLTHVPVQSRPPTKKE